MRPLCSLAFAILLAMGGSVPVPPPAPRGLTSPGDSCAQAPDAVPHQGTEEPAVRVTVIRVDRERGVLDVETEVGHVQVVVPPAAVHDVHAGDELVLCLADEVPSQN